MNKDIFDFSGFTLSDKSINSLDPKRLKNHPLSIELFGDLSLEEYKSLKYDIQQRGIQDALHIVKQDDGYIVISGHQRKKIAIEIGIKVPCIIRNDLKEEWQIEEQIIKDNLLRRHLTDYQKVQAGKMLEVIEKEKAKQRQIRKPKSVVENLPQQKKGKSRDKVAYKLGFSGRQYAKAKIVDEKATPEIKNDIRTE